MKDENRLALEGYNKEKEILTKALSTCDNLYIRSSITTRLKEIDLLLSVIVKNP